MDDADAIRGKGWRQGAILAPGSLPGDCVFEPALPSVTADSVLVVLTQDCDLIQPDFDKEPFVELIRAVPVSSPDGNLLYGKNPRRIQFRIGAAIFEASCHERTRIDRRHLTGIAASMTHGIDPTTLDLLREWVAKRYIRPAFPDSFNARIWRSAQGKAIRKLLERKGELFLDLYVMCDPSDQELEEGTAYRIDVWPTMGSEDYQDEDRRRAAVETCTSLEALLASCPGIEISTCELRHEGQITLDDLRFFARWDFDDLTHRETLSP
jgi:hypothetical protein